MNQPIQNDDPVKNCYSCKYYPSMKDNGVCEKCDKLSHWVYFIAPKQRDMVGDICKLCDDLRVLIPVYGPLSNTEIMLDVLGDKVKHETDLLEEISEMYKREGSK